MPLLPDPDAVKVIERIVKELLGGRNLTQIAIEFNDDKVPSLRDHQRMRVPSTAGRLILVDLTPRLPEGTTSDLMPFGTLPTGTGM